MTRHPITALLAAALLAAAGRPCPAAGYLAPECVTDGARAYQLARVPHGAGQFDASGTLHLVYWAGGAQASASTPSYVFHRSWRRGAGWSAQTTVDDPAPAQRIGGRHPSLALLPDGTALVAWHDHRHCTAAGNYIDNVEIYADRRTTTGSLTPGNIRLTTTTSGGNGDNGYAPRLATDAAGRVHLGWYDFTANASVSDIYLRASDTLGNFNPAEPVSAARLTFETQRGGTPAFTMPDLAVAPDGTRHMTWIGGTEAGGGPWYARVSAAGAVETMAAISGPNGDFFDPPRVAVGPDGSAWVAIGDDSLSGGAEDVRLWRRRPGQASFDAPVTVAPDSARQFAPDMAFAPDGSMHLAWVDLRGGMRRVWHGVFDPAASALVSSEPATPAGLWERPALAFDAAGRAHIVAELPATSSSGDIYIIRPESAVSAASAAWDTLE